MPTPPVPPADTPDDMLAAYLARRDAPCPSCGYNLRGLTSRRCPECDQELALRVALLVPRAGAFILGLCGTAIGTGFCILLLAFATLHSIPGKESRLLMFGLAVSGPLLALWVAKRRRLIGREGTTPWMLAAGTFALSLLFPAWFLIVVR